MVLFFDCVFAFFCQALCLLETVSNKQSLRFIHFASQRIYFRSCFAVMADLDPISDDGTPNKRRKLNTTKGWDSQDDSGDELTVDDFETATVPLSHAPAKKLDYTAGQMHADLRSSSNTVVRSSSPPRTFVTQPTQPLGHTTQPTQPLKRPYQTTQLLTSDTLRNSSDVLVDRSSPPASSPSPKRPLPEPIRKAPFAKPNSLLASAIAPPGTAFRRPLGVQSRPPPVDVDSDPDDPPIERSDDESQKPPTFRRAGNAFPNRNENRVKESPRNSSQPANLSSGVFSNLMKEFGNNSTATRPADDMISAYGSSSRPARPSAPVAQMSRVPAHNMVVYHRVEDVPGYVLRTKIGKIQDVLPFESVQRCFDALTKCKGNVDDAKSWLLLDEEQDAPGEEDDVDELSSTTPIAPKGIARTNTQSSQPVRSAVKQDVKASGRTIAEKYGGSTQVRRPSIDDEAVQPRRRLQQGRRQREDSPPLSSPVQVIQQPPQPLQRAKKQTIVISDDEEGSESSSVEDEADVNESSHEKRLLKFFNECSLLDLADLSAQSEDVARLVTEKRPFTNLDEVRAVSANVAQTTKSGKKSKARPIGEKIVDTCSEVWTSYDAIDELVKACEDMAKPIQEKLKSWGVASEEGELHLMNLEDAHDSGIGTPASSCPSDDVVPRSKENKESKESKRKNQYLPQPPNMNPECTLKDYQLVGLNWLHLLWTQRISCILADDMGLGKTCQVIAFLAQLQEEKVDGCALVIVPGSTLENWLREFERFAPSLKVQPYYGNQSERTELQVMIEENFDTIDVVVTTYDMAVSKADNHFLRKGVDPMVCIYDEAHALRNTQSQRYKQLMRFNPEFRILLTGTPLQNNLKELIAVLAFLMPDMFQDKIEELEYIFQHKATTKEPTENAALLSAQRIAKARSIVTPFILRRKKHQVLELPTKHSRVEYCDMTTSQADHYADIYEEASQFYADSKSKSAKQTSNILMALRKAAMHPLLARRRYDDKAIEKMTDLCVKNDVFGGQNRPDLVRAYLTGEGANALRGGDFALHQLCSASKVPALKRLALKKEPWMDSGKVRKFKELVMNFAQNGDRLLVFSQFTTMMDILESVLETLGIKFMRLDGSTNMQIRQDMIDTFTQDESITVFMLSTRAGGAGINLAAANKVIIFDSGFNPQDDIQAENRAHRVGQTREVEVIRLVSRGTIEEQIHALGESKLALDARVAGEAAAAAGDGEDGKKVEKDNEQLVIERMFTEGLAKRADREGEGDENKGMDLKDAFKDGLESVGVKVASKQAQF